MTDIRNTDDLIDSRDVIARIEELQAELEGATMGEETSQIELDGTDLTAEHEELAKLLALAKQGEDYAPDWSYGETMISDTYFETYAEELARDIGAIDRDAAWPVRHIDWEAAANELKQNYTSIDFDGETYWIR